jgi:hypothetical protein
LRLAERGQAAHNVGWFLAQVLDDRAKLFEALAEIANGGDLSVARSLIIEGGIQRGGAGDEAMLRNLASRVAPDKKAQLLMLAPFESKTWAFVDELGDKVETAFR